VQTPYVVAVTDIVVREWHESDGDDVWRLHHLGNEQTGWHGSTDHIAFDDLRQIRSHYFDSGGTFLLAEIDGLVVGMGGLDVRADRVGEVRRMRVDPQYQRRGIASALLARLEQYAVRAGIAKLVLDTLVTNEPAQLLYTSHGYVVVGDIVVHGYDSLLMEKTLSAGDS
jgi:ribosomal protein S18 acetylase RimI-like enzyme